MRQPDFTNLMRVLQRKAPSRPTLFEFFLNGPLYQKLAGVTAEPSWASLDWARVTMKAYLAAGYDYVTVLACAFGFPRHDRARLKSLSLNEGTVIHDLESFRAYQWPDPGACDYSLVEKLAPELPAGMKMIVWGPGGVLENVIGLVGYEDLCFMVADDPMLAGDVFDAVGSRLLRYYQLSRHHPAVGAMISNDDWGFNTQTMLAPQDMRKYVFPWHKKIVDAIHEANKPAILHSCGQLKEVMEDIVAMGYDGKHSYEDNICPVEQMYEQWHSRIAILGGIDLDFICRSTPGQIQERCRAMLEQTRARGAYALGTGNSVPAYVPDENYLAMVRTATE